MSFDSIKDIFTKGLYFTVYMENASLKAAALPPPLLSWLFVRGGAAFRAGHNSCIVYSFPVPGGRPSKLNKEVRNKLLQALAAGNHYEPACAFSGICYQTFRNWMKQGEIAKRGEYLEFFEAVQGAIAQGEIASVAKIKKAEGDDWRAAAWMLERRHPDRWASTQRVKLEVEKEMEKTLDHLERRLPPEVFDQVLAAIADEDGGEAEAGAATE